MSALALLQLAAAGGWQARLHHGRLHLRGWQPMPPLLLDEFRARREEVIHALELRNVAARVANADDGERLPRSWVCGLAALSRMIPPDCIPTLRWCQVRDDAVRIAGTWGAQAHGLGWTLHDVFGCHAEKPLERLDHAGLVVLVQGREVVAFTSDTAVIVSATGSRLTYYRSRKATAVLLWELG